MVGKMLLAVGCWLLAGPVIAQEWTFGEPEKLPAAINSDAEEGMPVLAPDGRTLYFTRMMSEDNVGGKYAGQDIWVSEFDGHGWTKADNEKLPFNNRKERNAVVGVSADGNTLYLLKARANKGLRGIYFSKRLADGWTEPELIPIEGLAPEGFIGLYVSPDFDVILISMEGADSRGEEDLYVSLKDGSGKWSKPKNLGTAINTSGFEISPFLTADKKRLFFSSNGHRGLGDADIFYSDRLYDSWETWSVPKNLGPKVNSPSFEVGFAMHGDSLAYFASNRSETLTEIYKASASYTPNTQDGQVLSREETVELFGARFSPVINFQRENADLLAPQKELLWYIGSKLIGKSEIKVRIEIPGTSENEVTKKRVENIIAQLALSGLEGSRIIQSKPDGMRGSQEQNSIRLSFLR